MYLAAFWRILVGMHSGRTWRLGHRPALDGLRGVAILLVIAGHLSQGRYSSGGSIGVTVFFVLSGFLITSLLLDEWALTGAVSLRAFYARRARRLLPALGLFLTFTAATYLAAGRSLAGLLPVVFYFGNWSRAAGHMLPGMNHTWSLAVEEQFYLMWPLVLLAVLVRGRVRTVFWVAVVGAVSSAVLRVLLWSDPTAARHDRISFGSDTNAVGLLAGCALAAWMTARPDRGRSRPGLAAGVVTVLIIASAESSAFTYTVSGPLIAVAATVAAIWLLCRTGGGGVFGNPVLRFVGRRSYGYYLWQAPMHMLGVAITHDLLLSRVLIVALTAAAAEVSWRLVERPAMSWRRHRAQESGWIAEPSHHPEAAESIGWIAAPSHQPAIVADWSAAPSHQ